jgi:hypothetical protein
MGRVLTNEEAQDQDFRREQKLIDICFELVLTATDPKYNKALLALPIEDRAAWVASNLASCGFKTEPCGASWGVLKI